MTKIIFVAVVLIGQIAFAGGGQDVGSGGDVVECRPSKDNNLNGTYSLDYVLTYKASNQNSDIAKVSSLNESVQRLRKLLKLKIPELVDSFDSFMFYYKNTTDYTAERFWEEASFGLFDIKDEKMVNLTPENCRTFGIVRISQAVIRQFPKFPANVNDAITYKFDLPLVESVERKSPLQASFLLVHEWLWDISQDVENNRRINRLLHSTSFETLSGGEIKAALSRMSVQRLPGIMSPVFRPDHCKPDPLSIPTLESRAFKSSSEMRVKTFDDFYRTRKCFEDDSCEMAWQQEYRAGYFFARSQKSVKLVRRSTGIEVELWAGIDTPDYLATTCKLERETGRLSCSALKVLGRVYEDAYGPIVLEGHLTSECLKISARARLFSSFNGEKPFITDRESAFYSRFDF
jgi:hypothetical protein